MSDETSRKAIPDMSDRELAIWFTGRMHEWFAELHARGVEVPVQVTFGCGAAAGVLLRKTRDFPSCDCSEPYELGRRDERIALNAELLALARVIEAAATPRAEIVALLEGLAEHLRGP
jgi:hypothetical protein